MKKTLLSLAVILSSLTLSAQTIPNGGFEAAMTPIPGFAYTYQTTGWGGALINGGPETSSVAEGSQAAKLVVTNDPALNTALSWGDDIISGIAAYDYSGPISNPATIQVDFSYKFTKMGADTALIQFAIYDTMAAGNNDDVLLYGGALEIPATVSAWTNYTLTMSAAGTGTANAFEFLAVSSTKGVFDTQTPTVGTTLWLDGVSIGHVGLNENNKVQLMAYPNPAVDVLNLKADGEISSVTIIGLDGKVISTSTSTSVNVADLTSGMYIYRVVTADGNITSGNFVKK